MMPKLISLNPAFKLHVCAVITSCTASMRSSSFLTLLTAVFTRLVYFTLAFALLFSTSLMAETVQRWQDSAGQWHFGDHAAAKGHNSKPVLVTTPISIIKNDQPTDPKTANPKVKQSRKTIKKRAASSTTTTQSNHCDQLRQQLYDQTTSNRKSKGKKAEYFKTLTARYEHECIAGQYYGNS